MLDGSGKGTISVPPEVALPIRFLLYDDRGLIGIGFGVPVAQAVNVPTDDAQR